MPWGVLALAFTWWTTRAVLSAKGEGAQGVLPAALPTSTPLPSPSSHSWELQAKKNTHQQLPIAGQAGVTSYGLELSSLPTLEGLTSVLEHSSGVAGMFILPPGPPPPTSPSHQEAHSPLRTEFGDQVHGAFAA